MSTNTFNTLVKFNRESSGAFTELNVFQVNILKGNLKALA